MPYNYHDPIDVQEENTHIPVPFEQSVSGVNRDTFILTLDDSFNSNRKHNTHILTFADPNVPGVSSSTHEIERKTPVISNQIDALFSA
jgi:hypothetical protein